MGNNGFKYLLAIIAAMAILVSGLGLAMDNWGMALYNRIDNRCVPAELESVHTKLDSIYLQLGAIAAEPDRPASAVPDDLTVQEQYYRGIYDTCRALIGGNAEQCNDLIATLHGQSPSPYEQLSPGFVFPPAVEGSGY